MGLLVLDAKSESSNALYILSSLQQLDLSD